MAHRRLSNIIAFDDGAFAPFHRGDVPVVGAVFADLRLDGVVIGHVRRDGANATRTLVRLVAGSKFAEHVRLVLLQGIALAGFNVVDVVSLHEALSVPVLVVTRRRPDDRAVRDALLRRVPGGRRKLALVGKLGRAEAVGGVFVQRVGLSPAEAEWVIDHFAVKGRIPEPLRTAHLIASALAGGVSRGRA